MTLSIQRLASIAVLLTFCVIVLGAYVRLSHAGLGCPDWPGCYGHITWPEHAHEIETANQNFPERPVEGHKAWKEMVHRYLAGTLVLVVLLINYLAWKPENQYLRLKLPAAAILVLILFQAALGMWTVTLKLLPLVVTAHLLGGLTTFSLLIWFALKSSRPGRYSPSAPLRKLRLVITTALTVLVLQIFLGGWTSANYSALACPDFPTCHNSWWPAADYPEAFRLWREVGVDYEGGVLDLQARVAIHWSHRIWAIVTFIVLGILSFRLLRTPVLQRAGIVLLVLLFTQVSLGISNIVFYLPLAVAVLHNAVAAVLLALLIWLLFRASPQRY
jgi:cytochrome c oxidase assembly protein subunit 15